VPVYSLGDVGGLGPIGRNFGPDCDQIDRADVMLARLRNWARQGTNDLEQVRPKTDGPRSLDWLAGSPEAGGQLHSGYHHR
jgi:hypothetical protein